MRATEAMGKPRPAAKGKVTVLGYRLFWESFGAPDRGTVLCLHGGPGVPHGYLTCLADLASFGYRIVFYDQLGVGASERPRGTSFFTIERGVEEAEGVRKALGLGRIHLLGNSYGGMLALAYAIKYQRNLRSLVVASGLPSVPVANVELRRLVRTLPIPVGVLPPPHLPPSDLASRADPVAAPSQRARLSDDVGTQRVRGPRFPPVLGYHGSASSGQGPHADHGRQV